MQLSVADPVKYVTEFPDEKIHGVVMFIRLMHDGIRDMIWRFLPRNTFTAKSDAKFIIESPVVI